MRLIFFGSPEFALPSLQALIDSRHEVVCVVTQPDRPAGRGHAATAPPVKTLAMERNLPVLQPEKVSAPGPLAKLQSLRPDAFVVAAYGQILRQSLLDVPPRGTLNVHASLLPRWRGASPVAAAIREGDSTTGVTLMQMVRALDAGPMLARVETPILDTDTTGFLEARLAAMGADLLTKNLDAWLEGRLTPQPQDESEVTYAPQLQRADAVLDWSRPAAGLWRQVRAYQPWPVAFTRWRGEELRIHEAWPIDSTGSMPPGTVLEPVIPPAASGATEPAFAVQTGGGALAVLRLQRPGKRAVSAAEFLRGQRDFIGTQLGS